MISLWKLLQPRKRGRFQQLIHHEHIFVCKWCLSSSLEPLGKYEEGTSTESRNSSWNLVLDGPPKTSLLLMGKTHSWAMNSWYWLQYEEDGVPRVFFQILEVPTTLCKNVTCCDLPSPIRDVQKRRNTVVSFLQKNRRQNGTLELSL